MADLTDLAVESVRTLHSLGKRIPGAGGLLADSLAGAVRRRTTLITGASSGIGEATALKVGAAGGHVLDFHVGPVFPTDPRKPGGIDR